MVDILGITLPIALDVPMPNHKWVEAKDSKGTTISHWIDLK